MPYDPSDEFAFLHQIVALPCAEITEAEFKKFLPLFAYREKVEQSLPVIDWLELVRTPFGEVSVYEKKVDDKYVNLLFIVPPLFAKDSTLGNFNYSQINLNEVITQAKLKSDIFEGLGDEHLREHFTSKLKKTNNVDLSYALRWNRIFERYKMPLIPIPGKLSSESSDKSVEKPRRRYEEF